MEPAFILIPNRIRDRTVNAGTSVFPSVGPCTSLTALSGSQSKRPDDWIASGHLNGWIVLWSINRRRSMRQWVAHPQAQVSTLFCWSQDCNLVLISQGRDGFIRFWRIDSIYPAEPDHALSSPSQYLTEIRTCEFTFCHMSFWPAVDRTVDRSNILYLAHVSSGEDESGGSVKGTDVEVIQLPENVIVANTSMDCAGGATIAGLANLGMCMALQGIPQPHKSLPGCLLLAAFESGHVFLLSQGRILARLDSVLGEAIPIMCLTVLSHPEKQLSGLIVLGGPSKEETSAQSVRSLAFVSLMWDTDQGKAQLIPVRDKLATPSCGVSSLALRSDARLLAIGQWDGEIRLIEPYYHEKWRVHQLGLLASLGSIDSGELLGDWAATTVKQPHGPIVDQQSTTVRGLLFTPESNWLISAAPASAGAIGSLLGWDVYRTKADQKT